MTRDRDSFALRTADVAAVPFAGFAVGGFGTSGNGGAEMPRRFCVRTLS